MGGTATVRVMPSPTVHTQSHKHAVGGGETKQPQGGASGKQSGDVEAGGIAGGAEVLVQAPLTPSDTF